MKVSKVWWLTLLAISGGAFASVHVEHYDTSPIELSAAEEERLIQDIAQRQKLIRQITQQHEKMLQTYGEDLSQRVWGGSNTGTGLRVNWNNMNVYRVRKGSPAAELGIGQGARVTEIGGIIDDGTVESQTRMMWALHRASPGEIVSISVEQENQSVAGQLPILTKDELHTRYQLQSIAEQPDPTAALAEARDYALQEKHQQALWSYLADEPIGGWDSVTFLCIDEHMAEGLGISAGPTVVRVHELDHPLHVGDIILKVGNQTPSNGRHLTELLFDYDTQALVPVSIRRGDIDLLLELPYPNTEKVSLVP